MDFNLFMYCTIGRRHELEAGMAGRKPELFQRMLNAVSYTHLTLPTSIQV